MLQDFNFKILHRSGSKHSNVNALSRNPVSGVEEDEKFSEEIQDITLIRELKVQTWIGRRSIRFSIMNNLFMLEASEAVEANYINEGQGAK